MAETRQYHIAVLMGSKKTDLPVLRESGMLEVFEGCGARARFAAISAHRDYQLIRPFCNEMLALGVRVFLGAAGKAGVLPGAIAVETDGLFPVLGIPLPAPDDPQDDMGIYCITGLPPGTVASSFGYGKVGLYNAAIQAVQIAAGWYPDLADKLPIFIKSEKGKRLPDQNIPLSELRQEKKA